MTTRNPRKRKKTRLNRGFAVQTRNGHAFDPRAGEISCVDVDDISHALSNLCRYSGHCRKFYSVAEHSVLVSRIVRAMWPDDLNAIWAGLMHDATEAYVGDLTTPIKVLVPKFMEIEDNLARDISRKLCIRWDRQTTDRVRTADMIALSTEARLLFADVSHWDSIRQYEPRFKLLSDSFPMDPTRAKRSFQAEIKRVMKELA